MKTLISSTLMILILALAGGFILATHSDGSFEQEAIAADMKEAGPQYEAALVQYPQASPRIYALYGQTPEFREVLQKYGHNQIVPIIEKCLTEGDKLLELATQFDELMGSLLNEKLEVTRVGPTECGWRAILLTHVAGNSFLGQYVIDSNGKAQLLPGSSALAIIGRLTTSGLQVLEKRLVLGERPTLKEWGLASLDVAVIGFSGKALATAVKRGIAQVARPTLGLRISTARAGIIGFSRAYAPRIAKYATMGGLAYLAIYHPSVITGAAGVIAEALGVSPLVMQTLVWGAILFVPLWILIAFSIFVRSIFRLFSFRPAASVDRELTRVAKGVA